ncbi:hypothetical protein [Bacillus thuringiensis]|uniref:hypothetical protein n=1 Tax=Bacillus thuringiensis TaxID=1428 RepID=UPI00159C855C|nr:hypothetical protein [Bacillus thuringiensis]
MATIKNLHYEGKFTEFSEANPSEDLIKEAEMFSVGTHRGKDYTESHLQTLVDTFSKNDDIPVQLDHSESARDTVGYLEEASVKDGKLYGKLRIIEEDAKSKVFKKLLKKVSVSFYTDKEGNPTRLREVSLVAFPQLKGATLFSENGFTSELDELEQTEEVTPMAEENVLPQSFSELEQAYKQLAEKMEANTEKFSSLEEKLQKFAEEKISAQVEKFQEAKKTVPAQKESLTKLLASFSEEQTEVFEEFMSNMGAVEFQEVAEVEDPEKPAEAPAEKHADFRESDEYKNYLASL